MTGILKTLSLCIISTNPDQPAILAIWQLSVSIQSFLEQVVPVHIDPPTLTASLLLLVHPAWSADISTAPNPCLAGMAETELSVNADYDIPIGIKQPDGPSYRLAALVAEQLTSKKLQRERERLIKAFINREAPLAFHAADAKPDRYGRKEAFIALKEKGEEGNNPHLLQEALISAGLARVSLANLTDACACHLLTLESEARSARTGLWKLSGYHVKKADALHLSAIVSTYQIISDNVLSVHRDADGTSYLNFGDNWYEDFTISLSKKTLQNWEAKNKILDDLQNKPIYVRGWVEDRGGPLIPVQHAYQLQYVGDNCQVKQ
ncbi:thermonuclease family protein [uncultured Cohaesibacter sp.]|uniref:thermonuclease family protein n=1 Tax=uncultured Cohaesibacter sp. TaxID=1002546 RepID=UPI0029C767D9|nr:thermonuclease family protein [uncultured Cohaesibacter sp.]